MGGKIKWFNIIRCIGLFLVLIYHFFSERLPGGFIGVDVFFTLSGYLITAHIIEETQKNNGFSLAGFFKRRFIRIYPLLFLMIVFTLPLTLLISPDFSADITKQTAAALGFVTNYYEMITGGSYEAQMLPHFFIHTWFLAVEAQLIVVWGFICALCALITKKIKIANTVLLFKCMLGTLSVTFIAQSFLFMQYSYKANPADPSVAYFNTIARAFPFFIGGLAGIILGIKNEYIKKLSGSKIVRESVIGLVPAVIAVLFIMASLMDFNGAAVYRYGILAASCLTVVLIIALRIIHEFTPRHMQEPIILSFIGNISYGVYLFHWPLYIVFTNIYRGNTAAVAAAFILSAVLTVAVINKDKKGVKTVLVSAVLIGIVLSGFTFYRAPIISSLEQDMYIEYIYMDTARLYQLAETFNAQPEEPEDIAAEITVEVFAESPIIHAPETDETEEILEEIIHYPQRGVTVIGDSVTLGARRALSDEIPECTVITEGSMQFWQGYDILTQMQDSEELGEYVVIALGTNVNRNSFDYIDRIVADMNHGHRLIFVTPYNGITSTGSLAVRIADYIRALPEQYPFVTVADWAEAIGHQSHVLNADRIHIGSNRTAIGIFVNTITDALAAAAEKPAK